MADYYDWQKTFSYDADVTMVVGARGVGKTFGLRMQFIRDFIKDGSRFVELTRYKNELFGVSNGYFNRVGDQKEFKDYVFKTNTSNAYIARKDSKDAKGKYNWLTIGYFVALSDAQRMKKRTFDHVRRILLDEAIIDKFDRYHTYLPNEYGILANIVDTVSRERADTDGIRPRVYLLGNAVDFANPYFSAYKVSSKMEFGYKWYANKTFLLHYVESREYSQEKALGTVAGRMMTRTGEASTAINNEFQLDSKEFVERKPGRAKFMFGIYLNGNRFGIWADYEEGLYYVNSKVPRGEENKVYTLTRSDSTINMMAARRADKVMKGFCELWYLGLVRYDTLDVKMRFNEVLDIFGIR